MDTEWPPVLACGVAVAAEDGRTTYEMQVRPLRRGAAGAGPLLTRGRSQFYACDLRGQVQRMSVDPQRFPSRVTWMGCAQDLLVVCDAASNVSVRARRRARGVARADAPPRCGR